MSSRHDLLNIKIKNSKRFEEIAKATFILKAACLKLRLALPLLHSLFLQIVASDFVRIQRGLE